MTDPLILNPTLDSLNWRVAVEIGDRVQNFIVIKNETTLAVMVACIKGNVTAFKEGRIKELQFGRVCIAYENCNNSELFEAFYKRVIEGQAGKLKVILQEEGCWGKIFKRFCR